MCVLFPTFKDVNGLHCVGGERVDSVRRAKEASGICGMCSSRLSVEA